MRTTAAARHFLPEHSTRRSAAPPTVKVSRPGLGAWREPWGSSHWLRDREMGRQQLTQRLVSVIDRHHVTATIGTLAYASFLAALTAGRWLGPAVLERVGRVTVLRTFAPFATAGVVVFTLGPSTGMAFAGTLLWGMGAALGFPSGVCNRNRARPGRRPGTGNR